MDEKVQFIALTKEEIAAMIRDAALVGAQVASDAMLVGQRKKEKERIDRRLHNTDLLLRNYRTLKASCENAVYESNEGEVSEVLEDIMSMKNDKVIVESIRTSAKRTALMVQHIDKMFEVYRVYCSKISERDKRRYKIIKALYIAKTPMTIAEISKKFSISKVTVYEDIKIAKERLSSLFFGIDGMKLF
ncbi:helix-turn-helix domain-containing protein [Parablautia sp. Marseille-Q6255]|uniref:helix-turn-helix domain-containing protein n=1 Tax=Parablautia sp. Marseille-Q6255 TaxID=3039593 RepID=UPI0024BC7115|nr:helix-turn-helix domain-containing protein [Parablautia sp. Marseille-Q6255]